jgi:pyocin large subunit-like protein
MKRPNPKRNGGPVSRTAAIVNPAKDVDTLGESVKALRLTRWMDMAIVMHRMGATDPAEYQRLGIWLHRMRRAVG